MAQVAPVKPIKKMSVLSVARGYSQFDNVSQVDKTFDRLINAIAEHAPDSFVSIIQYLKELSFHTTGVPFPLQSTIAKKVGYSEITVYRVLRVLREIGFIKVITRRTRKGKQGSNFYQVQKDFLSTNEAIKDYNRRLYADDKLNDFLEIVYEELEDGLNEGLKQGNLDSDNHDNSILDKGSHGSEGNAISVASIITSSKDIDDSYISIEVHTQSEKDLINACKKHSIKAEVATQLVSALDREEYAQQSICTGIESSVMALKQGGVKRNFISYAMVAIQQKESILTEQEKRSERIRRILVAHGCSMSIDVPFNPYNWLEDNLNVFDDVSYDDLIKKSPLYATNMPFNDVVTMSDVIELEEEFSQSQVESAIIQQEHEDFTPVNYVRDEYTIDYDELFL